MATIAQIRADLVGSSASFRAAMVDGQRQANTSLAEIRRDVASTSASISALSKTAAGFIGFEAVKAGVSNLLDAQKAIQQIHYSLLSATGSGTAANEAYDAVSKTAQRLGLDLQTSALGFSSMSAAANANGVSMKDQMALFEGLARSSTVLHLSSEQSGRAITALSQIFGKGKIQAEELRQQLGDAIPGVVPRFQAAVMAMTKGTDLAGKSFDQLLQGGDVTVQRFLPALIQALNDTGRGAEQAVNGPVAAMNRLSSEWFKLKADLSGGLFADAAVGSINLVTNNLEHLADVAGITGGLVIARLTGNGLDKAATGASGIVQQQRESRAAALAATELAAAETAAAAAEIKQNEAALRGVTVAREQAIASRDAAAASLQKAIAENEAAQATLNHQRTAATLSANTRAQRIATADAAAAQASLTRAQVQYNASAQATVALKEQQIALEGALFRARGAATIATEAEIAAERQLAATGAAGLIARGAAGVGNFALSLVGGPWGAAVAAIGAVGYAIYDTQKRSEDYRHETDELVKSIQQVRTEAEATAKTFGTLDSSMSIKQGLEQYQQESQAIAGERQQLADLQSQAQKLRETISARASTQGGAGNAIADAFDERKLEQITQRIDALRGQLGPASTAVDALGTKMSGALAPSIDSVKHAIDQLAKGKPLLDVVFDLSAGADKGIAAADTALANVRAAINGIAASTKQMTDKAATDGLNNAQKAAYDHQKRLAEIAKLAPGLQGNLLTSENDSYAPNLRAAQQLDAADAAKKAATEAASQARQWKQQADNLNQSLQQTHNELTAQLDTTQRLTPEEKKLQDILRGTNDAYNHAAASLQKRMLAQAQANAELSKSIVLHQQEAAAEARSATLRDQLAARIARQTEANDIAVTGVGHGQQLTQQLQDELRIRQEYDRQRQQYDKEANRLQPGVPGSKGSQQYDDDVAGMFASQQQELALYRAGVQSRLEAEQDWANGARAAFEDYASAANDVAGQTKLAFTNAFSGLEDALANFAQTGKINFSSLANSIIADLARMQAKAATNTILKYAGQAIGAYFGGSSGVQYDLGGSGADYSSLAGVSDGSMSSSFSMISGRANGGSVDSNSMYEVAEGGKPELLHMGGRSYLMTGPNNGQVTQAGSGGMTGSLSGGGLVVNITNNQGDAVQATARQSKGPNGLQLDIFIDAVKKSIAGDVARGQGAIPAALSSRYSLNKGQNLG